MFFEHFRKNLFEKPVKTSFLTGKTSFLKLQI